MCKSGTPLLLLWLATPAATADVVAAAAEPATAALAAFLFASASATSCVAERFAAQKVKKYREPAGNQHRAGGKHDATSVHSLVCVLYAARAT